jgi:hypothetical protein
MRGQNSGRRTTAREPCRAGLGRRILELRDLVWESKRADASGALLVRKVNVSCILAAGLFTSSS